MRGTTLPDETRGDIWDKNSMKTQKKYYPLLEKNVTVLDEVRFPKSKAPQSRNPERRAEAQMKKSKNYDNHKSCYNPLVITHWTHTARFQTTTSWPPNRGKICMVDGRGSKHYYEFDDSSFCRTTGSAFTR